MVNVQCSLLWLRHQPSNEATEKLLAVAKMVGILLLLLLLMIKVATAAEPKADTDIAFFIHSFIQFSMIYCMFYKNSFGVTRCERFPSSLKTARHKIILTPNKYTIYMCNIFSWLGDDLIGTMIILQLNTHLWYFDLMTLWKYVRAHKLDWINRQTNASIEICTMYIEIDRH